MSSESKIPKVLRNENGITIRQLKEWVKDLIEVDSMDDDTEVWIMANRGVSNLCVELHPLNVRDLGMPGESCDIILLMRGAE